MAVVRGWHSVVVVLLVLASAACSARYRATSALAEAALVRPDPQPQALVADPAMATLVVVRPGDWTGMVVYFDEQTDFLGATNLKSKTVVKLAPGAHTIYAATFPEVEATRFLRGTFEAGKIYFVEQGIKPSIAGGNEMFVISPRNPKTWSQLQRWVAGSPTVVADVEAGRAFIQRHLGVIARCRELADDEAPDADEAPMVTIQTDDGFVEAPFWDVTGVGPAAPTAPVELGGRPRRCLRLPPKEPRARVPGKDARAIRNAAGIASARKAAARRRTPPDARATSIVPSRRFASKLHARRPTRHLADGVRASSFLGLERGSLHDRPHDAHARAGYLVGRYEVVRCIGRGGMGEGYEALHQVTGRPAERAADLADGRIAGRRF